MFFRILTFYLFLNWFSTSISDNRKYVCGRMLYACINPWKFKGLDSREFLHHCQRSKSDYTWHVISIIAKNNPHAHHKTHLHTKKIYNTWPLQFCQLWFLFFFRPLSCVHFFQSNKLFQAVEFVDRHIPENL